MTQALHLLQRDPASDAAQAAARRRDAGLGPTPAQLSIAKWALPEHPVRRRRQLSRPVRHQPVDELERERAVCNGYQRPQLASLRLTFALSPLPAGDVDLH